MSQHTSQILWFACKWRPISDKLGRILGRIFSQNSSKGRGSKWIQKCLSNFEFQTLKTQANREGSLDRVDILRNFDSFWQFIGQLYYSFNFNYRTAFYVFVLAEEVKVRTVQVFKLRLERCLRWFWSSNSPECSFCPLHRRLYTGPPLGFI